MQQSHADRAQDVDGSIFPGALGVCKRQREDAACPHHYQVDRDEGLHRTAAQMSGPYDAAEQQYHIIFWSIIRCQNIMPAVKNYKIIKIPIPMAAIIIIHQIIFTTTTRKVRRTGHEVA